MAKKKSTSKASGAKKKAAKKKVTGAPAATKKKSAKKTTKKKATRAASRQPAAPSTPAPAEMHTAPAHHAIDPHLAAVIQNISQQMNSALSTLEDLSEAQTEREQTAVNLKPLDRATASFQRLVAEVVEDQLAEMLPPLITMRNELAQYAGNGEDEGEVYSRGRDTLDHVLELAGVQRYEARIGEEVDPLIHLAVGEASRDDLADGAVAQALQPGFRSARGKVLVPARVRVNRR